MSWLSSGLKKLKPLGKIVNKVTDFAAPIAGYIPGIGPEIAGGVRALGDLAGSQNLKTALLHGVETGGQAWLGGKLAGKLGKLGGASGLGSSLASDPKFNPDNLTANMANTVGGDPTAGSDNMLGGWAGKLGSLGSAAAGAIAKGAGAASGGPAGAGGSGGGGFDWKGLLGTLGKYGLPAIGALDASKTAGQADKYRQQAIDLANTNWAAGAPLRTAGTAGLLKPLPAIDVNAIYNQPRPAFRRVSP